MDNETSMHPAPGGRKVSAAVRAALAAGLLAGAAWPVFAADAADNATAKYQRDRQACMDGRSTEDRATCLKEAGAALEEARRGALTNGDDAAQRARNAVARCQNVPPSDQDACQRMARGEGQRSGSVAGGGVLTEIVTPDNAPPPGAVK